MNLEHLIYFIISENDGDLVSYDVEVKIANFTRRWNTFDIARSIRNLIDNKLVECSPRFKLSIRKG